MDDKLIEKIDWQKVTSDQRIIDLLIRRETLADEIRLLDPMALAKFELASLDCTPSVCDHVRGSVIISGDTAYAECRDCGELYLP